MTPPASPRSEDGQLTRRRAEGKLRNLEARLAREPLAGTIGIGHTRWATHGRPTESNAHPHATDRLAVVHNGIIENFRELREELESKGAKFGTETDTEVVAHLVTEEMKNGRSPAEAVEAALPRLRGAFALAFLFAGEDDLLIGARKGSPLAIGYGDGEMYLGSDAIALAPFTDTITYLEDGDWAVLTRNERRSPRRQGQQGRARGAQVVGVGVPRRQGQLSPLHGEGNPRAAGSRRPHARALSRHGGRARAAAGRRCRSISARSSALSISACGTAYYAGLVAKYWFERFARLPVEIDVASEFRYREAPLKPGGLAIFVSQSGETADTLATLRYAKEQKQHVARGRQRADLDHRARKRRR